jgi:hypothetical protein
MSKIHAIKSRGRKKATAFAKYRGELAKPIVEPPEPFGLLRKDNAHRAARQRQLAKLETLFEHFKIDPTSEHRWLELAISLAVVHVPGMRVSFDAKSKGGRPGKWKAGEDEKLLRAAKRVQQGRTMTFAEVVRELLKSEEYGNETFKNLDARYREARRREKTKMFLGSDEEAVREAFLIGTPLDSTN